MYKRQHKRDVEKINTEMLGEPTHTFDYTMDGKFPESSIPCPLQLQLRVGARVMTIVNNPADGYYNGTIGNIVEIGNDEITVCLLYTSMNSCHKLLNLPMIKLESFLSLVIINGSSSVRSTN